ncbi:hypothetical protein KKI22_00715 [Patescibacteria group bacterium]|nr:hypothetical protein [Patescibacteria group bacterium]
MIFVNEYKTSDFCLASSLLCKDFPLIDTTSIAGTKKVVFTFQNSSELQDLINLFWCRKLAVNPQAFHDAQKFIKSSIYEKQNRDA